MGASDLREAAARADKRRKILKQPVMMIADDPENIRISKADFIAKRRKQKEEELAVEEFKRTRKVAHHAVAEEGEPVKKGRAKKVKED